MEAEEIRSMEEMACFSSEPPSSSTTRRITWGDKAFLTHPHVIRILLIAEDRFFRLANSGINSEAFGKARSELVESVEAAFDATHVQNGAAGADRPLASPHPLTGVIAGAGFDPAPQTSSPT